MENFNENKWEHRSKNCKGNSTFKSVLFGILVLAAGIGLLLKNMSLIPAETASILFSWQMLVIAIGFINLFGRSFIFGLVLMLIGGFFMGSEFFGLPIEFSKVFWPSLIILAGVGLVFGSINKFRIKNRWFKSSNNVDHIDEVSVFGGAERNIVSESFKGGKILAVFGGSKFDLTRCKLADEKIEIELVLVFGGTQLIVPADWNVKIETMSILGGFSDKRNTASIDYKKTVILKGVAVLGGGEIKSF